MAPDPPQLPRMGIGRGKQLLHGGQRITRSARAGLVFPVGRIHRYLKNYESNKIRVSPGAAVYLAAVLEYITSECIDAAADLAYEMGSNRINPRQLTIAIREDRELNAVFKGDIPGGGVLPKIHKDLLKPSQRRPPARPVQTEVSDHSDDADDSDSENDNKPGPSRPVHAPRSYYNKKKTTNIQS